MVRGRTTPTHGRGSRATGVIAGHILKIGRRGTGATQEQLAESMGIDTSTVQGWESGRRPIASIATGELFRLFEHLCRHGAPASIGRHLRDGVQADIVLSAGADADPAIADLRRHPLSGLVLRRSTMNLITWPFSGVLPPQLSAYSMPSSRRGPTSRLPVVEQEARHRFFDHAIAVADRAVIQDLSLLRRQMVYLLGFDSRSGTAAWLRHEQCATSTRYRGDVQSMSSYLKSRSAALALGTAGDVDHVHRIARITGESERLDLANLNYWAYWLGELVDEERDDEFLTDAGSGAWNGATIFRHLGSRLSLDAPHRPLNLHSMHRLLSLRPDILMRAKNSHDSLADTLDRLEASDDITRQERDQVAGLNYALRVARR